MARNASALAKLSRPRLHTPIPRSRLFTRLDALRQHPVVWISGPPGAGKTTLIASYLDSRKLPAVWCQLDASDADPATFFYYLGLAAKQGLGARQRTSLPLLRPEYLIDLPGFARRFFRALFAGRSKPGVLVLDNVQEVTGEPIVESVLVEAVSQVPEGFNLVLVSRAEPPQTFSRSIANRSVAVLDWNEIRLTLEETRQLVELEQPLDDLTLAQLHARSAGWVAGLILLLEHLRHGSTIQDTGGSEPPQQLFDYFAAQILSQASPENQHILLHLGFLPRMTIRLAEALTGSTQAPRLLDHLYRHHLFTDRRQGAFQPCAAGSDSRAYEFHALFRSFLRHQASETYSAKKLSEIATLAAGLLERQGAVEDAVQLYLEAGNWPAAESLLLHEAERLITQGRGRLVSDWTARLPAERVDTSPWLLYWSGAARLAVEPALAREKLERAYQLALAAGDVMCQIQTAAEVVETYFHEYSHFIPLDRWIPVLRRGLEANPLFPSREAELRVWLAFLDALTVRPVAQEMLPATIDRVFELFSQVSDVNLKVSAARTLLLCSTHKARLEVARQATLMVLPLLEHPDLLPITRAMALFALSWYSVQGREYDRGMAFVCQMERLAKDQGMPQLARLGHYMGGLLELFQGNIEKARERASLMEQTMFPNHPYDVASNLALKAWIGVSSRDPSAVLEHIARAIELFDQVGSSLQRQGQRNPLHWAYAELGNRSEAMRCIDELRMVAGDVGYLEHATLLCELSLAYLALKESDSARADAHLRTALHTSREHKLACWIQWFGCWMPELCAEALRAGIEPDYVRSLIREHRWSPPSQDLDDWPWLVRVRVLGNFELELDDKRVEFTRKTPKKVLALLKAIVALGGRNVPAQKLIDTLWPEEEADAAHEALTMAVRRLRILLRDPEVIVQTGGELSIHPERCWVDAWAFERAASPNRRATQDVDSRALSLYRGGFLQQDGDAPWAIPLRERLRARFIQIVERHGHRFELEKQFGDAIECYLRGLEADELVELFYQRLMRCYVALERPAEALSTFRRMRQTLSLTLGIKPSAESEALYQQLVTPSAAGIPAGLRPVP